MSAISSVGSSTPTVSQLQASVNKQPPQAATPAPSHSAGNDADHDGDSHDGGIDIMA